MGAFRVSQAAWCRPSVEGLTSPLDWCIMCGPGRFAEVNCLIDQRLAQRRPLVMAHRGSSGGSIAENTSLAVWAALRSGADIVEIDACRTSDGAYFAFHDGLEAEHLGREENLTTLTAEQVAGLSFRWLGHPGRRVRIESLAELLGGFRGETLFNIDRGWTWWPDLLDLLTELDMPRQLLLKCPSRPDLLGILAEHRTPFPFLAICHTQADLDLALTYPGLNLVGVEIIAATWDAPLARAEVVHQIHQAGRFALVNAEVLPIARQCWPGYCDETAISDGPEAGWGDLIDRGFDVIQTDWPGLLSRYRDQRAVQERATRAQR